ncbi:MAG: TnpV protein [Candidatus Fimenecus sp.]
MKITYTKIGDYNFPNIAMPQQPKVTLGIYGRARERYLKEHNYGLYAHLNLSCTLLAHLAEVQERAKDMEEKLVEDMAKKEGVNEKLKAQDQMLWVQKMNNIYARAREIVMEEVIYT